MATQPKPPVNVASLAGVKASGAFRPPTKPAPASLRYEMANPNAYNPKPVTAPASQSFLQMLQQQMAAGMQPPQTPGENRNQSGTGGGGGGGGGGRAGPDPAQVRQWASELFNVNAAPYMQQWAQIDKQKAQANAYNPDFAGMQAEYATRAQDIDRQRAEAVAQRLGALTGFGQQLAGQQGTAMAGALQDLGIQGANTDRYAQQANMMGAERTQGLANQGQYMGQLNAAGASGLADTLRSQGLIAQGGQATLANNRGTLLNQLDMQQTGITAAQAKEQQAMDQARREFLLKYGVT